MAYIESHQTLRDHPKLQRAAELLGISEVSLVGHLHFLWWWALDYAPTGSLVGLKDSEIARASHYLTGPIDKRQLTMWDADDPPQTHAEAFVRALLECNPRPGRPGFLERGEAGLALHDWMEYSGALADYRAILREANAERQRNSRARKRRDRHVTETNASHDGHMTETRDSVTGHGAVESSQVLSSHTPPISPCDSSGGDGVSVSGDGRELFEARIHLPRLGSEDRTDRERAFTAFRKAYPPNPDGTEWSWAEARKAWQEHVPPGDEQGCLDKLALYKASERVRKGYVRAPANWVPGWRRQMAAAQAAVPGTHDEAGQLRVAV